jgi:tetratricopeptide (TPR) repeat protein
VRRDFAAAEKLLRQVIESSPSAEAFNQLGAAQAAQRKYVVAEASFTQAVALAPQSAEAHYNLALVQRRHQQLAAAAAGLRRAIELRPDFLPARLDLADVLYRQGNAAEAVVALESFPVIQESLFEEDEDFYVELTDADGASVSTINFNVQTYIENDDDPPVASINNVQMLEGDSGTGYLTFSVSLSAVSGLDANLSFYTSDGDAEDESGDGDYGNTSDTFYITAGNQSTTIAIPIYGDTEAETDESFFLTIEGIENVNVPVDTRPKSRTRTTWSAMCSPKPMPKGTSPRTTTTTSTD